jgi:PmbA protein
MSQVFAHTTTDFQHIVDDALKQALKLGATDAAVEVSESMGLSVSVRMGELENVERNRDKSLGLTVYLGQRRGSASTSDFSKDALVRTVQAAYDIARFTAEDPAAGLPDADQLVGAEEVAKLAKLDLFHPWDIDAEHAAALALRAEDAARGVSPQINNSEGAGVSAYQAHFGAGNSRGFRGGYASSSHSLSVAPIAKLRGKHGAMQGDHWYTSKRDPKDMATPEAVGRYAAERCLSRLHARKLATCEVPVLFESTLASGLLGSYVQAVSGGSLYRKSSFLVDSLGKQVWADHIDVHEDPFVAKGRGSSPFDEEGVRVHPRHAVKGGVVEGYFLSTYSARKLGMKTTGHAGGSHNLVVTSRQTQAKDNLDAMLRKLHRGLFVVELMGQGVSLVTGDYSRGAAGFWVENGRIAYPVHEITIAGNLKDMLRQIVAVGADAYTHGAKTTGSILIERMTVAGA